MPDLYDDIMDFLLNWFLAVRGRFTRFPYLDSTRLITKSPNSSWITCAMDRQPSKLWHTTHVWLLSNIMFRTLNLHEEVQTRLWFIVLMRIYFLCLPNTYMSCIWAFRIVLSRDHTTKQSNPLITKARIMRARLECMYLSVPRFYDNVFVRRRGAGRLANEVNRFGRLMTKDWTKHKVIFV